MSNMNIELTTVVDIQELAQQLAYILDKKDAMNFIMMLERYVADISVTEKLLAHFTHVVADEDFVY